MLDDVASTHWVSPTQQSTYSLCPRKWGFQKLDRIPLPPNRFAERGLAVHEVLEKWHEKGTPIDPDTDAGKIAMPGLKFLPPPGTGLTENSFTFESDTATYVGLWDLLIPIPRTYVGNTPIIEVYDYKTTTDFKWMKSFNDLRQDPQAIIYSIAALFALYERWQELDSHKPGLCLCWIYFRANPSRPGVRRVWLWVLPDEEQALPVRPPGVEEEYWGVIRVSELEQRYQQVENLSAEMLEHHRLKHKGLDLPMNTAGCRAYGGCPYQGDPCVLTTSEIMRGLMAQESAADKIRQRAQQGGTEPAPGAEPAAAPPRQTTMSIADKIRAKTASSEASPEVKAEAEAAVREAAEQPPAGRGEPPVNPPEAELPQAQNDDAVHEPDPPQTAAPRGIPEAVESFSVTALGLAERVQCASIIAAGLVSGAPSMYSIEQDAVAEKALEIVDAITLKAIR
jgi:hypothetical protein